MKKRIISMLLVMVMCLTMAFNLASCKDGEKDDLIIMTDALDGLFNPFFSTSAADGTIVSMTQIGMLSSKYVDGESIPAYGQDEATVALDFEEKQVGEDTVFTFVLKNGIKFSDGQPLTMEDVLFNLYVYLDPVYSGSSTMYSTDIKGLLAYRANDINANETTENLINNNAISRAQNRLNTIKSIYYDAIEEKLDKNAMASSMLTVDEMISAIKNYPVQNDSGYLDAISDPSQATQSLLDDYQLIRDYFREELESDYRSASEIDINEEPYEAHKEAFSDTVFLFMYTEGYVSVEYERKEGGGYDYTKIKSMTPSYDTNTINTQEKAIDYIFNDQIQSKLDAVVTWSLTADKILTDFTSEAKGVILKENSENSGTSVDKISGIVSLGHPVGDEPIIDSVTIGDNTYKVAHTHNEDGTPANEDEYDVLQITINGIDPKAKWNFSFSVAPQHYYGDDAVAPVNLANNQFGVIRNSFDFMKDVLQTPENNRLPLGAGPYKATNRTNDDNPSREEFYSDKMVYFKANEQFETVGEGLENAKIQKVRYLEVSAANAIGALKSGSVDYITPQYTKDNAAEINALTESNYDSLFTDQLGYGYIGVNASKVTNINVRKAIMCAMNTTLALDYYNAGTAEQIYWPMSKVSWAYPKADDDQKYNGHDYPQMDNKFDVDLAKENIAKYMSLAIDEGVTEADLKFTFTIAGSNLNDHPCYKVFRDAAKLLNETNYGFNITVKADQQALTKIATGSLDVWAAAWGSALDPDMYQVYHQDSQATSVKAWGYPYLKGSGGTAEEKEILQKLSDAIDAGRETYDQAARTEAYRTAMSYVLDLAVELPVYQRSTIYVYNTDVINPDSLPEEINPYSSPLDRIWEIELAN